MYLGCLDLFLGVTRGSGLEDPDLGTQDLDPGTQTQTRGHAAMLPAFDLGELPEPPRCAAKLSLWA